MIVFCFSIVARSLVSGRDSSFSRVWYDLAIAYSTHKSIYNSFSPSAGCLNCSSMYSLIASFVYSAFTTQGNYTSLYLLHPYLRIIALFKPHQIRIHLDIKSVLCVILPMNRLPHKNDRSLHQSQRIQIPSGLPPPALPTHYLHLHYLHKWV